ncbi:WecB/TagA/CpsF family glycosyltransferase [Candidatus Microgenomates bacterium]|nr:WecB/TagA/CpsF family glycosyltransferase [Candidatus Microgenomates bacterium]
MEKIKILKIGISDVSTKEALEETKRWLKSGGKKRYIVTPNPEFLVAAQNDREFNAILNNADLALPDGMGLIWASRILNQPLKGRITGVDFMEKLCFLAAKDGFTIGLIGGGPTVAERASECLKKKYPGLKIVLAQEDWKDLERGEEINLLFVALGAPKQEIWMSQNLERLPVKVAMGVGGAFDYLAGIVPRAPKWMRNLGLEWLFRLICQPWRIKRQTALIKFVYLVLLQKFKGSG